MADYGKLIEYLNSRDKFAAFNDIRITKIEDGYAEAEAVLSEHSVNGLDVAQGGLLYTLADFCFAGAANANTEGKACIGMSSNISYLRPGKGKIVKAVAKMINRSKHTCLAEVTVFSEENKKLAYGTFSGFVLDKSLF